MLSVAMKRQMSTSYPMDACLASPGATRAATRSTTAISGASLPDHPPSIHEPTRESSTGFATTIDNTAKEPAHDTQRRARIRMGTYVTAAASAIACIGHNHQNRRSAVAMLANTSQGQTRQIATT